MAVPEALEPTPLDSGFRLPEVGLKLLQGSRIQDIVYPYTLNPILITEVPVVK